VIVALNADVRMSIWFCVTRLTDPGGKGTTCDPTRLFHDSTNEKKEVHIIERQTKLTQRSRLERGPLDSKLFRMVLSRWRGSLIKNKSLLVANMFVVLWGASAAVCMCTSRRLDAALSDVDTITWKIK
jgi:hypothetical protein